MGEPMRRITIKKHFQNQASVLILTVLFTQLVFIAPALAGFNDCAIDWNNFTGEDGFIADYTYKGQAIKDYEATGSGDPTHGQANVPPAETDLASAATSDTNPGNETTPYFGYYNGGTPYNPLDPSTMNDDYIFFRMRVSGDPSTNKTDFTSYHWNVLFDIDADGYKEYWIDIDGGYNSTSKDYDRIQILYDNSNNQVLDPDAPGVRIDYFRAYHAVDTANCSGLGYSHTRVSPVGDGSGDYWIDEQIPMTAFKDSNGNQLLYPNSPVAFVFSTGASNQDPLQKDWMMDLNWISDADPITFGDIVHPDGTPIIEFTNNTMDFVSFYTVGNAVYVYVKDPLANENSSQIEIMTVTVTDPATGDDEVIILTETGENTGIFVNAGETSAQVTTREWTGTNTDGDGWLETVSGNKIYVSYTNENHITSTDEADIVAPCEPFIQFTRANGLPSESFVLTNNTSTSDKLYVTVTHYEANTNASTIQTITVNLTGHDTQSLTLTETGINTGVFRNTTGLNTLIEMLPVTAHDNLWEDVDGGVVAATYTYPAYGACPASQKSTSASVFVTLDGGRVYFTDATGLQDLELYGPGQNVYIKVIDYNNCGTIPGNTITVTVTNSSTGDSDNVTLTETAAGSCVYLNSGDSLVTKTFDGAFVANDNELEMDDGAILTVTYIDASDGDSDPSNDAKTDTATYNAPSIVINEVLFYPQMVEGADCVMEYVQLYNATPSPVDVTHYRITDGDTFTYTIPQYFGSNLILNSQEKIYVALYDIVPADRYDGANGAYYLFTQATKKYCSNDQQISCSSDSDCPGYACVTFPSIELNDPHDSYPSDQILLYDNSGVLIDYVGWSSTINPDTDFLGDDSPAVTKQIWQDDAFVNVASLSPGEAIMRSQDGYDSNSPNDWVYAAASDSCNLIITRAVIASFTGHTENGKVVIGWKTASEIGTAGFYLYRKDNTTGNDYLRVNRKLVPGILTSRRGGEYRVIDETAVPGNQYSYLLLEIESNGQRHTYGPYPVTTAEQKPASADPVFAKTGYSRKPVDMSPSKMMRLQAASGFSPSDPGQPSGGIKPPSPANPSPPPAVLSGTKSKASTCGKGIFFIDAEILFAFPGTDIAKMTGNSQLKITSAGLEVPYLVAEDKSGIYFYGQELKNVYTDKNVYWLEKRAGKGMEIISGTGPSPATGNESFFDIVHSEEDMWAATTLFTDPDTDYWMWDYVVADDPVYATVTFTADAHSVAPVTGNATLAVHLHGATNTDHHAVVSVNGTAVGESSWYGTTPHAFTLSFNQSLLSEGENQVTITGLLDGETPYSIFYIDALDIGYHRLYQAVNDTLFLNAGSHPVVTVSGFTGPEIKLFEITNPQAPKLVKATTIETADDGTSRISFAPTSPNTEYLAVHLNGLLSPLSVAADSSSRLTSSFNHIDYMVITPKELKEGAQALADYRKSKGFRPAVVELEDIMDEFNHGIYSPYAIKHFLSSAFALSSRGGRFRSVVLLGHGSEDYKNLLGLGENLFPPIMIGTIDGIVPSDNHYADMNGDHIPELAVGRLPVMTAQELQSLIAKIKSYEISTGLWTKDILLLADYPEPGGDFPADSEWVASLIPPSYVQKKIYLSHYPIGDARQMLMNGINQGAVLLNFIGHAGLDRLAGDGMIVSDDVSSMNNGEKLPVLTGMTCMLGFFSLPGYDTLGEEMLIKEHGGVIAVFAPASMSVNAEAAVLDRELFHAFFTYRQKRTLGDIILSALQRTKMNGVSGSLLEQYTILGDPALLVK